MESSYTEFLSDFHEYLLSNSLIETETLSVISECKLGISGQAIKKLINSQIKSWLNLYRGSNEELVSLALKTISETFTNNKIHIVVVLEGLSYFGKQGEMVKIRLKELEEKDLKNQNDFSSFLEIPDELIFSILNELGCEVFFAPYSASAQLKFLFANEFVNSIFDELDFLVYCQDFPSFPNLITDIDISKEAFSFFDTKKFMWKTLIKTKNYHSFFVLGGVLDKKTLIKNESSSFIRLLKHFKSKDEQVSDLLDAEDMKKYNSQMSVLKNMLILNAKGELDFLIEQESNNTNDLGKIFGNSLPNDLFIFLMNGILSKDLASILTKNSVYTMPMFAESIEERKCQEKMLNEEYPKIIRLLTANLSNSFHCSFEVYRHYMVDKSMILEFKSQTLDESSIGHFVLKKNQNTLKVGASIFAKIFIQQYLKDVESPKRNRLFSIETDFDDLKPDQGTDNSGQILANAYSFFFKLNGYIDSENEPTIHLSALRKCEILYEEELILLLEILKSECSHLFEGTFCNVKNLKRLPVQKVELENLNSLSKGLSKFDTKPEKFPKGVKENEQKYIYCISRVFALVPSHLIKLQKENDDGNIDMDMAKFKSVIELFQKKCRFQFESILWYLFTNPHFTTFSNPLAAYKVASKNKPFRNGINVTLGVHIKSFLLNKLKGGEISDSIKSGFKHGMRLWKNIKYILEYQSKKLGKKRDFNTLFEEADLYLCQKVNDLKIT